jgi:hypothetical protein
MQTMANKKRREPKFEPCSPPVRNGEFLRWVRLVLDSALEVYRRPLKKP